LADLRGSYRQRDNHCSSEHTGRFILPSVHGMSIPAPSGSRLAGGSAIRIDVTGTEDATIWIGRTTPTTGAVPVIYCHGFAGSGTSTSWRSESQAADDFRAICGWGHPVIAGNVGGASTWGNQTSLDAVEALITWARTAYGTRTDRVAFAGESMGALTALNAAIANPDRVAAVWLRVPAMGLEWTHDNVASFTGAINAAYGGAAGYLAALDDYDPMRNVATLRRFKDRIRIWATANDEFFPRSQQAIFAGQIGCRLDTIGGAHANGFDTPKYVVAKWLDYTIRN
jgi:pimeloyl-ACP methyl ester carboxylesterase